jgi:hypothetical protein
MVKARLARYERATALLVALLGAVSAGLPRTAGAFGPLGHRIAGLLAEPALCPAAREQVADLGGGQSLAELGLWADQIRGVPGWERSAPWHYMNVDERDAARGDSAAAAAAIREYRSPPEGDVLSAIARFRAELSDRALPDSQRAIALRFLVHLVVDLHQPLHVGRGADRGGNDVDVRYGPTVVNLHRFWDTDVLELRHLGPERYARTLRSRLETAPPPGWVGPAGWAAESLALRPQIYAFQRPDASRAAPQTLDAAYLAAAQVIVDERLVRAAERLAATLNEAFCAPAPH